MNTYYFLNYWVYYWYSKRDPQPKLYAVILPAILFFLHLLCLTYIFAILFHFTLHVTPVLYISAAVLTVFLNYVLLYRNNRYQRLFNYFHTSEDQGRRYKKILTTYVSATIICLFLAWLFARTP